MKTWTQWLGVSEPNDTLSLPINKFQYEEIQKDAVSELEKALRKIADFDNHPRFDLPPETAVMSAIEISKQALSATEKPK